MLSLAPGLREDGRATAGEMGTMGRLALALALPAAAHGAFTAPMRGWMTWERYTCETDCTHFPFDPPLPPRLPTCQSVAGARGVS